MYEIVLCSIFLTFGSSFHFCEKSPVFLFYTLQLQMGPFTAIIIL